jgi:hypothetical protein
VARLLETEALLHNQLAVLVGKSLALLALCCFLTMGLFSSLHVRAWVACGQNTYFFAGIIRS